MSSSFVKICFSQLNSNKTAHAPQLDEEPVAVTLFNSDRSKALEDVHKKLLITGSIGATLVENSFEIRKNIIRIE